jgi:AcrR family transcriptional regulator
VRLADREGIEGLSMRRLGQKLGVEAMSLYNHVKNKDDLLDGMVDVVVAEIEPRLADADWRIVFRERVLAARKAMLRHPWAAAVIVSRKTITPTMMGYMDSMAGILRNGGFSIDLTHHAMHLMGSRVLGFAQELYDDSEALSESPAMVSAMLEQMAGAYPHLAEIARTVVHDEASVVGTGCDDQFEFEFALDLILDGLERLRTSGRAAAQE